MRFALEFFHRGLYNSATFHGLTPAGDELPAPTIITSRQNSTVKRARALARGKDVAAAPVMCIEGVRLLEERQIGSTIEDLAKVFVVRIQVDLARFEFSLYFRLEQNLLQFAHLGVVSVTQSLGYLVKVITVNFYVVTIKLVLAPYGEWTSTISLQNDMLSSPHFVEDSNSDGLADGWLELFHFPS